MKRAGLIFVIATGALVALLGISSCRKPESVDTSPIRIGVVMPLTGDAAVYGKAMRKGIELAHAQEPAIDQRQIQLLVEDDQGQPRNSVLATQRLIDVEHVTAVIGGAMSSTAEAVVPICTERRVVLLSPTATKPSLTTMGQYFFRLWPSDDFDGQVMAETAYSKLGLRRVAVLYVNTAYGVGITEVFDREFTRLGGEIVSKDGYPQAATDFRTVLTKIAVGKPEAVYLPGYVNEVSQILKQAQQLDFKPRFLGVNSLYDPKLIEVAGSAAEGAVLTYPTYDPASQDPLIAPFVSAYKKRYSEEPDPFAAQGYDSYRVLVRALKRLEPGTGAIEPSKVRTALLEAGPYSGPGGRSTFDAHGDVEKPLRVFEVRDGRFVLLDTSRKETSQAGPAGQ